MPEKKLRAILLGILMWLILFIAASIIMYKLGENKIGTILIFAGPIISLPIAYWYMRAPEEKSALEGFKLGLTWFVLSLTLDVIFLVYVFKNGWEYFQGWTIWVGYAEIVVFATLVGALMKPSPMEEDIKETSEKAANNINE